jgi:sugar lactone lactonase YvrE
MSRHGVNWSRLPASEGMLFEGPRWIAEARVFQWVDILAATIHRWDPYGSAPPEHRATGLEFATVALPLDADRMLVASRSSLHLYSWLDATLETVGQWDFPSDVRFNDGAISPTGDVYLGTMSMERRKGAAALYRFDLASGSLTAVLDGIGISNGLSWDTTTSAYYVDSLAPQIDRLELIDGPVVRSPWVRLGSEDEPDGLTIAPDGTLVVALWGGSRVVLIDPSRGSSTDVLVPALFPTSVAFGGVENELVIVTAGAGDASEDGPARVFLASAEDLLRGRPGS